MGTGQKRGARGDRRGGEIGGIVGGVGKRGWVLGFKRGVGGGWKEGMVEN